MANPFDLGLDLPFGRFRLHAPQYPRSAPASSILRPDSNGPTTRDRRDGASALDSAIMRAMWPRLRHPWTGALAPSRKVAIGAATFVALTLVTGVQYLPARLQLREGQVSPRDVTAPRTVEFVDRARTDALRRAAAESIQPVYRQSAGETSHAEEV